MSASCIHFWWMGLLALVAGLLAFPEATRAQDHFAPGSVCHASYSDARTYEDVAGDASLWICDMSMPDWTQDRTLIRHDLRELRTNPSYAVFPREYFGATRIEIMPASGSSVARDYTFADVLMGTSAEEGYLALPATSGQLETLVFTMDDSLYPEYMLSADFVEEVPFKAKAGSLHLLAALICGLLLAPIIFDLGFARTLRESFPLYHSLFCATAFLQTASASGVLPLLFDLTYETESVIAVVTFDLMLMSTAFFTSSFLEDGVLKKWEDRALVGAGWMAIGITVLTQFGLEFFDSTFMSYLLQAMVVSIIVTLFYTFFTAWRRGSYAVRYVALALSPIFLIGTMQLLGGYFPALQFDVFDSVWAMHLALLFEVSVTAFAVADRFLSLKRERDSALSEARSLESLSERDALTGLLNRRALEARFAALRAQGFTALAIVDLDHFKRVNDTYGHNVGDDVLKSAAHALMPREDQDLLAFRIGGEEFLLLLRGRSMQIRAEERRKAVTKAIAEETDIAMPVTASMGYLEATTGALADACFDTLYERADRLLYEAKENGRNRMMVEKVKVFQRRAQDRREERQAA